jgi:hypothetical protein
MYELKEPKRNKIEVKETLPVTQENYYTTESALSKLINKGKIS